MCHIRPRTATSGTQFDFRICLPEQICELPGLCQPCAHCSVPMLQCLRNRAAESILSPSEHTAVNARCPLPWVGWWLGGLSWRFQEGNEEPAQAGVKLQGGVLEPKKKNLAGGFWSIIKTFFIHPRGQEKRHRGNSWVHLWMEPSSSEKKPVAQNLHTKLF